MKKSLFLVLFLFVLIFSTNAEAYYFAVIQMYNTNTREDGNRICIATYYEKELQNTLESHRPGFGHRNKDFKIVSRDQESWLEFKRNGSCDATVIGQGVFVTDPATGETYKNRDFFMNGFKSF